MKDGVNSEKRTGGSVIGTRHSCHWPRHSCHWHETKLSLARDKASRQRGVNSEKVRHLFQNKFAHNLIAPQAYFRNMSWDWKPYYQYQTNNPYTLW
jgi:hypothetical protein